MKSKVVICTGVTHSVDEAVVVHVVVEYVVSFIYLGIDLRL
jgi:hypothetical protein